MKRSSPLKRHARSLRRTRPRTITPEEAAAREIWKEPHAGWCSCGCQRFALHLDRHHVTYEQHVRVAGGDLFDLSNSMLLSPICHRNQHDAIRRIPVDAIPDPALAFMVDLLGEGPAAAYLATYYGPLESRAIA